MQQQRKPGWLSGSYNGSYQKALAAGIGGGSAIEAGVTMAA
jgi:hypothetical protein